MDADLCTSRTRDLVSDAFCFGNGRRELARNEHYHGLIQFVLAARIRDLMSQPAAPSIYPALLLVSGANLHGAFTSPRTGVDDSVRVLVSHRGRVLVRKCGPGAMVRGHLSKCDAGHLLASSPSQNSKTGGHARVRTERCWRIPVARRTASGPVLGFKSLILDRSRITVAA